ncbi:SUMF1/EgtB/PvdO family nonheme iron enzyme [Moraxella sp.]|uniref:SUMF1/EgtB/PvdO family nonheme iron enzyme n=1 Tax=Moraxella sp. TaxID=479 RepID=UPI00260F2693|nr:SUMF1/EgtB/PvdO family nonheme iron enzyme [Moraxella sp.]MCP3897202.1 SUMF1/EgtB/PvdO family nonheme iron enzyme [Moraxella sp.]
MMKLLKILATFFGLLMILLWLNAYQGQSLLRGMGGDDFSETIYRSFTVNEKRLALVIGNSRYPGDYLPNPQNDAEDMAKVLRQYGFTVIHKQDLNQEQMDKALINFAERLSQNGVGLFFYAGHGLQIDKHNYLVPIGPKIQKPALVKYRTVDAQFVVDIMQNAGSRVNIVILDACRSNPYRSYFRSQDGLAAMDAPRGTIISYATALGKKAADGDERNGLYTQNLLKAIKTPGLKIEEVFKQAARGVDSASNGKQIPWRMSSLTGDFCFTPCAEEVVDQEKQAALRRTAELERQLQVLERRLAEKAAAPPSSKQPPLKPQTQVWESNKVFRDRLKDGGFGPEMVQIPAGRFQMGDIQGGGYVREKPVHRVSVSEFAMGRYEVTFAEYDKFAQATGREKPRDRGWGRGNRPVINVSWNDAVAYTEWLSKQTGKEYRLPTEAEWEYAARAGTESKYWWGNKIGKNRAACDGCGAKWGWDAKKMTAPVGSFAANPFGLYDTVGNVWEWTCSEYESQYSGKEKQCMDKNRDGSRVVRGGSWGGGPGRARVSCRCDGWVVAGGYGRLGFRVVRITL